MRYHIIPQEVCKILWASSALGLVAALAPRSGSGWYSGAGAASSVAMTVAPCPTHTHTRARTHSQTKSAILAAQVCFCENWMCGWYRIRTIYCKVWQPTYIAIGCENVNVWVTGGIGSGHARIWMRTWHRITTIYRKLWQPTYIAIGCENVDMR